MVMGSWSGRRQLLPSSRFIPILLRHATSAICNSLQHMENQINYLQTITALAQTVDAKDKYTLFHSRNVTAYTLALADRLGITGDERNDLWNAALLHDIGKIGIPETILNKAGRLTTEEYEIIKTHPVKGCNILEPIIAFKNLLPAIRYHHERYDGKGYPDGLSGRYIPISARILAVADSFDAMTSNRVYRLSPGVDFALAQIEEHSGTQFDPNLAKAFQEILKARSFEEILRAYSSDLLDNHPVLLH
jgi:putative nucleotidyltransferase with HDIG domain